MDFNLTAEQQAVQRLARDFAEREIIPSFMPYYRSDEFPTALFQKLAATGLVGGVIPERYGGGGMQYVTLAVACEEIARAADVLAAVMIQPSGTVGGGILAYGAEAQRQKYLRALATGKLRGGIGLTEARSGSDVGGLQTRAVRDGDHYVLNGGKAWISFCDTADFFVVYATLDPKLRHKGITAFIVERGFPGFASQRYHGVLGLHPTDVGELSFADCRVPAENLVGEEYGGFKVAMVAVDRGRLWVACRMVGISQACLDACLQYASERVIFGQPIGRFQLVQARIADMMIGIQTARLLALRLAWLLDKGATGTTKDALMAKLYANEVATRTSSDAVLIHGAYGISDDYVVQRAFRDAKVFQIAEGNNDMLRARLGEYALGYRRER